MFLYRCRVASVAQRFGAKQIKPSNSDDDFLFTNENIESTHVPKSHTPLRRGIRFLWRVFTYGSMGLFAYTYYSYKNNKDYLSQPAIFEPFLKAVRFTDYTAKGIWSMMMDPPLDKLLPDLPKMPPGYATPKTLVLDLKGTILSTEYVFGKGYVIMKRPGLTEFLQKMSKMYEVVILCEEETFFTSQLAESLDPERRIFTARMGRECLCYRGGELVKDLSYLNRDLKNVVIVDKSTQMVRLQSDNAILLPEFTGDENDKALIDLIPFLEHLIHDRIADVREEIKKYGHAETGKKYLQKLARARDQLVAKQQTGLGKYLKTNKPWTPDGTDVNDLTPKAPV